MVAPRGCVRLVPLRAKHLHHLLQTQPFNYRVDPGSVAQLEVKRHTRLPREHRTCIGLVYCHFSMGFGAIRGVHGEALVF
jgi:hypothetical protein